MFSAAKRYEIPRASGDPGCRLPTQVADATRTGSSLHAPSLRRFARLRHARRGSRHRLGLGDHRPQRQQRLPEGGAERPGARQLHARGKRWNVLAWGAINALHPTPAASRSSSSSTTRAATAPTSATSGRPSRTPAAPTTAPTCSGSSPAARRPTAPTGRSSRGSGCCRTTASRRPRSSPSGSCGSRHFRGALPVLDGEAELGLPPVPPHLRLVHLPRPSRARLQVDLGRRPARHLRPQPLPRHLRLGLRQGLAAREQLPDAQGHGQVLLRLLPPRQPARRVTARSTARRSSAPASCPTSTGRPTRSAPTTRPSTCRCTRCRRRSWPAIHSARPSEGRASASGCPARPGGRSPGFLPPKSAPCRAATS